MCSRCPERGDVARGAAVAAVALAAAGTLGAQVRGTSGPAWTAAGGRVLRVCADPNNLPFSDARGRGFENALAELAARELGARVAYTWWAQRRGFVRNTLGARACDVYMGVPAAYDRVWRTRPYYRSTYVFVARPGTAGARVRSMDDPALRRLRVGVTVIGDDFNNTPPAHALGARGIVRNVVGYSVYGDYRDEAPPARVVDAVARGEVDVAVAWGPMAGYWAARAARPLAVRTIAPRADLPFAFDIAVGVRRGDTALRNAMDGVLVRRRVSVDSLLRAYHVPRVDQGMRK